MFRNKESLSRIIEGQPLSRINQGILGSCQPIRPSKNKHLFPATIFSREIGIVSTLSAYQSIFCSFNLLDGHNPLDGTYILLDGIYWNRTRHYVNTQSLGQPNVVPVTE